MVDFTGSGGARREAAKFSVDLAVLIVYASQGILLSIISHSKIGQLRKAP